MPHVTRWLSSGELHIHTTPCDPGEGTDACLQRHLDAVAAFQVLFPEDPE